MTLLLSVSFHISVRAPCRRKGIPADANRAGTSHAGPSAKFEGESMYHGQYPAHEVQQRAPRPQREAYKSGGAFDGTTTSRSAYTAHPIPPRTVRLASCPTQAINLTSKDVVLPCLQILLMGRYPNLPKTLQACMGSLLCIYVHPNP